MTDVMRNYVKSKECKRKMILNYFDHKVPSTQGPAHMCCDFHSAQCACDDCLLARAADDMDCVDTRYPDQPCDSSRDQSDNEPTPLFSEGIQAEIKKDRINYRLKLQSEVGKSTVDSVALSSGFSINLIDLVLQHLPELASVEKVKKIVPLSGLSLEAGYRRSSGGCESSSHRLLGHVCQKILQKYNSQTVYSPPIFQLK